MSEIDRLKTRLAGVRNFRITPGTHAREFTPEQIAAEINKALDQVERGDCETVSDFRSSGVPKMDVRDLLSDRA